ncbi:protein phsophatase-2A [Tritrichomonas foetus]|uniref:Protein phsophatase-2A n=1 Tax=Tritrichomonas foetus TaxID=1144522 RepID=A0A1J4JLZ0_9EUKA|nr:protein phsophatase-2A [Tritrichomonas foetus]|eukprot:OHS98292.1 protein phsophatase-2A [Tritrichomonas foetus]
MKIENKKKLFKLTYSETDLMNNPYGFENECTSKLNVEIFRQFSSMFGTLPVGHIIGDKVLVVHGGLFSDESVTIETIQGMVRFGQPPESGPMNDILWSDPMDKPGHAPSPRGVTQTFGPDVTEKFLKANNLELLIRSHQVQEEGYLVQHDGKCITVFSAPNYIGRIGNKGAIVILSFEEDGTLNPPKFEQFTAQPIPVNFKPMKFSNLGNLLMRCAP